MRAWNTAARALFSSSTATLVVFIEMGYRTPLYLATSAVDIVWNGITWSRAGSMGSIDQVKDSTNGETSGLRFALSGVPIENLALALEEMPRGKLCRMHLAVANPENWVIVDVQRLWSGVLDQLSITQDGATCTVAVTAEHQGKVFARPKPLRYNASAQDRVSPGDTSMRFIISQANHQDVWPAAAYYYQK